MSAVRPHVSYSELLVWETCQWKWFKLFREGVRSFEHSPHFDFGTAIHSACERAHPEPDSDHTESSIDEVVSYFEGRITELYERNSSKYPDDDRLPSLDDMLEWGPRILRSLDELDELREASVLFTELRLLEPVERSDDIDIKFKGYVDLVIKTKTKRERDVVYICDYKTCGWGWGKDKLRDENVLAQLRLYKHFFAKKFNVNSKDVRTAYVLLKKRPGPKSPAAQWVPVSSGDKTTMRAVTRLNKAITGMHSNDYRKNRDACVDRWGNRCPLLDTEHCQRD